MKLQILLAYSGLAAGAIAAPQTFSSGPAQVALIELYSSEGCSSCPPAESWLNLRINDPHLWKTFVPVEFHVNYWNNLGWRDRLSSQAFTEREYRYAEAWGQGERVYTPCFVMNGQEYRPTQDDQPTSTAPAGELSLEVAGDGSCRVAYHPLAGAKDTNAYEVQIALLGSGLSEHPNAGENRGASLYHDFVVIGLDHGRLAAGADTGTLTATLRLPPPSVSDAKRRAVAVWVTRRGSVVPVQATGGWLL